MKADGSVIIDTKIGTDGLEKGFERLKADAKSLGLSVEEVGDKIALAFSDVDLSAPLQNAIAKVQELENKLQIATDNFNDAKFYDDDKAAEMWANRMTAIYDRLEVARRKLTQVVGAEASKQAAKEQAAAKKAQKEHEKSYSKATKAAKKFSNRLSRIISSALVFNLISKALSSLTQYFSKALKSNQEFSQSWDKLKGALLTAFQPIYETLLPVLTELVQIATKFALVMGRAFSSLSGKNADQMKENAEALYDQANATEELGEAAKKAKKSLAGFDELNVMSNNDDTSSSSSTADFDLTAIDLDSKLSEMVVYTSAAILALGIILACSGVNIPLGIGMIAIGALGLYQSISENWGELGNRVGTTIDAIMAIGGALILTLGIILVCCVPSKLALGIGMIIAGATLLATAVALNWNSIVEALQTPLGAVVGLLAGAVLVIIGILVCMASHWPVGIGLIVAGAAALAGTVALNWNIISDALKGPLGVATAIVSAALLVIGVLLCFANKWLLGVGLIVAGAVGLATTVAVNWNAITNALQGPIGAITALVSGALLVLGIILVCTGVGIPLGIGMIIAGAAGLVTVTAMNWNAITDKVKEIWQSVKNFWNKYIAPIFTLAWWKNLAIKCGNGLLAGFEGAINGIISMFEKMINWVVGGLNKISFDVPDWVPGIGGKTFGFNIPEVSFGRVSIPRLAQGAVIPANQEFLAVLGDQKHGTNIEAPLTTIQEAVALVMEDMTNGMMAGFEALLEENQRLRAAVEGIEVGDSTIGQAANRYNQRMAIIRG